MKTTGVVRRIDELGRIVIPKEIRKTMRIRDGENVEIYVDHDQIILRKYSLVKRLGDFAQDFTDSMHSFLKHNVIITDNDSIIAVSGSLKKDFQNKELSEKMINLITRRENILEKHKKTLEIVQDKEIECTYVMKPIIVNGDMMGMVIILSTDDKFTELEEKKALIAANFFNKYLSE